MRAIEIYWKKYRSAHTFGEQSRHVTARRISLQDGATATFVGLVETHAEAVAVVLYKVSIAMD